MIDKALEVIEAAVRGKIVEEHAEDEDD